MLIHISGQKCAFVVFCRDGRTLWVLMAFPYSDNLVICIYILSVNLLFYLLSRGQGIGYIIKVVLGLNPAGCISMCEILLHIQYFDPNLGIG